MQEPADRIVVSTNLRPRYAETDAQGVVHHSSYVVWLEVGRTEFMRHFGYTYRQLEETGVVMPVLEINVRYRLPAFYDDDLQINTWVEELTRTRLRIAYTIVRRDDGKLLTEGWSLHTFTGKDGRPLRITHYPEVWARLQSMHPDSANP